MITLIGNSTKEVMNLLSIVEEKEWSEVTETSDKELPDIPKSTTFLSTVLSESNSPSTLLPVGTTKHSMLH